MNKNFIKILIIGIIAGIIFGLFSTGGGLILLPAFLYLFNLDEKQARATSIFCILPMVLMTSFFYTKNNYINWKIGINCAIGGSIGSFIGSKILKNVPDYILKIMFCIFLFYMSINILI